MFVLRETNGGNWEGKTGAQNREEDFENFVKWIDGQDNPAGVIGERRSEVASHVHELQSPMHSLESPINY